MQKEEIKEQEMQAELDNDMKQVVMYGDIVEWLNYLKGKNTVKNTVKDTPASLVKYLSPPCSTKRFMRALCVLCREYALEQLIHVHEYPKDDGHIDTEMTNTGTDSETANTTKRKPNASVESVQIVRPSTDSAKIAIDQSISKDVLESQFWKDAETNEGKYLLQLLKEDDKLLKVIDLKLLALEIQNAFSHRGKLWAQVIKQFQDKHTSQCIKMQNNSGTKTLVNTCLAASAAGGGKKNHLKV
jgi:hypothetical protein